MQLICNHNFSRKLLQMLVKTVLKSIQLFSSNSEHPVTTPHFTFSYQYRINKILFG